MSVDRILLSICVLLAAVVSTGELKLLNFDLRKFETVKIIITISYHLWNYKCDPCQTYELNCLESISINCAYAW